MQPKRSDLPTAQKGHREEVTTNPDAASAFLIADFTGHRGGVYFETGYAMGRGLPVIWMCRKDDVDNLHFDIRQYNSINRSEPTELAKRLQKGIEALLGRGPRAS
jgi:nucleoside 2-deoxyribosyltransferase